VVGRRNATLAPPSSTFFSLPLLRPRAVRCGSFHACSPPLVDFLQSHASPLPTPPTRSRWLAASLPSACAPAVISLTWGWGSRLRWGGLIPVYPFVVPLAKSDGAAKIIRPVRIFVGTYPP